MSSIKDLFGKIYKNEMKPKRYYNTKLELDTMQELFNIYVEVYKYGLIELSGGDNTIQISNISMDIVIKNKFYMESFGISPELIEYSLDDLHKLYIEYIGELRTIEPNIFIKRIMIDDRIIDIKPKYPKDAIFFSKLNKLLKKNNDFYNITEIIFNDRFLYNYKKRFLMSDKLFILRMKVVY